MAEVDPNMMLPLYHWKRDDLVHRMKEANAIAREYRNGNSDPCGLYL